MNTQSTDVASAHRNRKSFLRREYSCFGVLKHTLRMLVSSCLILLLAAPAFSAQTRSHESDPDLDTTTVDPETEAVIRGGLKWLASKQNANGSWSSNEGYPVAMTGYVLIAYLSTGNLPDEGEYSLQVTRGLQYLLNGVSPDGIIGPRGGQYMYGHGIATIALAELYGQTKDQRIRPKLELAVKRILTAQNHQGGWRYNPDASDADISVTVLQVVALRAAKNAGLDIPQSTIDRAVAYVHSCYDGDRTGGFTYQPRNNQPGFARTAAAIYSLQVCGQYTDPQVKKGSDYLFKYGKRDQQWFTYGHFYAGPAQYMIGGETWKKWYPEIRGKLMSTVRRQGDLVYWIPADRGQGVNEVYATAVYTMILALPYHYVPLYQR